MNLLRSPWGAVSLVLVVAAVLLLPGLGTPFDDDGEGIHAEIAREILLTGDWVTLHLNGVRYFDKPPLLYWLIALSMKAWGQTEQAARFWPVLGALAALAGTAFLGTRLLTPRAGVFAGLSLLTSVGFFVYARYLRPETLFIAAIQWGLTLLLLATTEKSHRLAVLGCAALGVAALVKDPLGAVGPLAAVALALAVSGRLRPVSAWLPWHGVVCMLVLGFGWYLLVAGRNPGFLWYTVVDNHVLNVIRARQFPDEDVPLTSLEFLTVAGLGAFPWILPAGLMVGRLLWRQAWQDPRETPWVALALWATGIFALFTLAPFKLPHYGLPAYPAIALLAVRWWEEGRTRTLLAVHFIVFAVIALGAGWVYWADVRAVIGGLFGAADVYTRKEALIGQAAPFPPWEDLRRLLGGTALVVGVGSLAVLPALSRGARVLGLPVILVTLLAWLPLVGRAESLLAASRSVRELALEVKRLAAPEDLLVHEGPIENSGALEFYGGRRPRILDGRVSVLGFGARYVEARDTFWERPQLVEAWRGPHRVFLLTTRAPANSAVANLPTSQVYSLAVGGGRWLYSNRP